MIKYGTYRNMIKMIFVFKVFLHFFENRLNFPLTVEKATSPRQIRLAEGAFFLESIGWNFSHRPTIP